MVETGAKAVIETIAMLPKLTFTGGGTLTLTLTPPPPLAIFLVTIVP